MCIAGTEDAKAVTVSLLPDTQEMSEDVPIAPIFTSRNRFFGIPLTDSAPVSPKCGSRSFKKLPEKPDLLVDPVDESEGDGDVLARLKRQINLDRRSLMALYMELDEERSASAVAANNAMAMITRLQAEKAAVQMEASQYQRMMEEQAEYDKEALQTMKDMVFKREEEVTALEAELEMYTERYGVIKKIGSEICEVDFDDDYQDIKSQALSSDHSSGADQEENELRGYDDHEPSLDCPGGITEELALDHEGERSHLLGLMRELERKMYSTSDDYNPEVLEGNVGEKKEVLTRDVSLIRERLRAVEAESGFLKHAAMTLQRGGEGIRVLNEIAQHLRKLRQKEEI